MDRKLKEYDMDRKLKQKIRKLWRDRFLVTIGGLASLGFTVVQLLIMLNHLPLQDQWGLELAQRVEAATKLDSSSTQRKDALLKLYLMAKEHNLPVTKALVLSQDWLQEQPQLLTQAYQQAQDLDSCLAWSRVLDLPFKQAHALDMTLAQNSAQDLAQILSQTSRMDLAQSQALLKPSRLTQIQVSSVTQSQRQIQQLVQLETEITTLTDRLITELNEARGKDLAQVHNILDDLARDLVLAETLAQNLLDSHSDLLRSIAKAELRANHQLELQQGPALNILLEREYDRRQILQQSQHLLLLSLMLLGGFLLGLTRLKISYTMPPNAKLIAFFPEECVAELGVLQQRMRKKNASVLQIRLRLLQEVLTLLWVFYIQVQIENLGLPPSDRSTDD